MGKQNRYVLLDLGKRMSDIDPLGETESSLALEIHRKNCTNPYSRYHVQRVIPCKFERGKLYTF